jgi:hypothetical protein
MKIILNNPDKEGVTYDFCFSWRNGYYLCICHEARLKERYPLNFISIFGAKVENLGFLSFLGKICLQQKQCQDRKSLNYRIK